MDDKLFDIFSEETEVPECVLRRVNETLEMILFLQQRSI